MKKALLLTAASLVAASGIAQAGQGDWIVRGRAILVSPTEDTSGVNPTFPNGSVDVDDAYAPELDFTYMFKDNWGVELILGTTKHDLVGTGDLSALNKVGDVGVLPPTLTLQYHFQPEASVRPYAGVGLNYTLFYDESASSSLETAIGNTSIDLDDSFGIALQAGFDVDVSEKWFLNFDVKYIQIDTEATLNTGGLINKIDVDLDPVVYGIGIGTKF